MAVDMFIKIGDIVGESQDKTYADNIDVLAWSWGMSQSGTTHMGGGSGAGKVNVQDLSITKYVDNASPTLMLACCNGKHYPTAKLVVRKAGENPLDYMVIEMKDVIVSSVSTGGSGGEDRLTENVVLNFGSVKYVYTPQDKTGKGGSKKPELAWNIPKNENAF